MKRLFLLACLLAAISAVSAETKLSPDAQAKLDANGLVVVDRPLRQGFSRRQLVEPNSFHQPRVVIDDQDVRIGPLAPQPQRRRKPCITTTCHDHHHFHSPSRVFPT